MSATGMEGLLTRVQSARDRWLALRAAFAGWARPLALAAALLLGLFFNLGGFPLFDVDEGAFSEATREMLERGDFVSTWLNDQPRYDKPILTYWLQAASVSLFGVGEFAFRLPSALAACAWMLAILAFTRHFVDEGTGYAAAFIGATSAGVTVIGRGAIADALLNLFLALAMFDIYRGLQDERTREGRKRCVRRAFLWMGLGLLTKGPVALLVPAAGSALAFGLHGRLRDWWRAARDPFGWLLLLAVAAPWYLLEYARRGDAFLEGFILRHNVERFLAPLQGHGGGPYYYVPAVLLLVLPYTGLLLAALPGLRRLRARPLDTFLWCWFLFVFAFFSLAGTKLPHYLLYGVTPLFILMARQRPGAGGDPSARVRRGWGVRLREGLLAFLPPLLFMVVLAALPRLLQRFAPSVRDPYVREALGRPEAFGPAWEGAALALLVLVLLLALWRGLPAWPRLAAAGMACSYAIGGLLLPALAELQQGPVKEAAQLAARAAWPVRSWRINVPSFSLYRGAVTPAAAPPQPGDVLLTRSDALPGLGAARVLYRKGGVLLVWIPG